MLFHMSMAAERPEQAARMIAELWDGRAYRFPPVAEGSWIAMAGDDRGSAIEFYPLGTELHEAGGESAVRAAEGAKVRNGPVHLAIATALSVDQVKAIAARHQAPAKVCARGPFHVIELWLEGSFMFEVLTPEMQAEYRASMHFAGWEGFLAADEAALARAAA